MNPQDGLPSEQKILECKTDYQILKILEGIDGDGRLKKIRLEPRLDGTTASYTPVEISVYTGLADFVNLLMKDYSGMVATPNHSNNIEFTFDSRGTNSGSSSLQDMNGNDEAATANKPSNSHKLVMMRHTVHNEILPDDFQVSDWLYDPSHYTTTLPNETGQFHNQRWQIPFDNHVEITLGLIARVRDNLGSRRDKWACEYWNHKAKDYITITCLAKMKQRLDWGKSSFISPELGECHDSKGHSPWSLLTTTYDRHAASGRSSKTPSGFLLDTRFHSSFGDVLIDLGITKIMERTRYVYDYSGKRLLGQALAMSLQNISSAINRAYVASAIWQSVAGKTEDDMRKHKLLDLVFASRSVRVALDHLSQLMRSCIVLKDGVKCDLLSMYLAWVGLCHKLNDTVDYCAGGKGSSKDEAQIAGAPPATLKPYTSRFKSISKPPSTIDTSTHSTTYEDNRAFRKSGTSEIHRRALKPTFAVRSASSAPQMSSKSPATIDPEANASTNNGLQALDELNQDYTALITIDEPSDQLGHWATQARRWLRSILLHWQAIGNIFCPSGFENNQMHHFTRVLDGTQGWHISTSRDGVTLNINEHFERLMRRHHKPTEECREKLMEWLSRTGHKEAWFSTVEFTSNSYCEGIENVFYSLPRDIRRNQQWSSQLSIHRPRLKQDHEIHPNCVKPTSTTRRVLAVSRGCCPAGTCLISLEYTRTKAKPFEQADTNLDITSEAQVDIMQPDPEDGWYGVDIPRWLQYRYFEEIADRARKRVEDWAELIFSDTSIEAKLRTRIGGKPSF